MTYYVGTVVSQLESSPSSPSRGEWLCRERIIAPQTSHMADLVYLFDVVSLLCVQMKWGVNCGWIAVQGWLVYVPRIFHSIMMLTNLWLCVCHSLHPHTSSSSSSSSTTTRNWFTCMAVSHHRDKARQTTLVIVVVVVVVGQCEGRLDWRRVDGRGNTPSSSLTYVHTSLAMIVIVDYYYGRVDIEWWTIQHLFAEPSVLVLSIAE